MTRAITIVWAAVIAAVIAAALPAGCDRIVNLTPAYDAQPALDAHPDSGFGLDAGPADGHRAFDDGTLPPDDGSATLDAFPGDGNTTPDDAIPPAG